MKELLSNLRKDGSLTNETKLMMVNNWAAHYKARLNATQQHSDQLKENLTSMDLLDKEVKFYKEQS